VLVPPEVVAQDIGDAGARETVGGKRPAPTGTT
jgi:hypothetical protein